MPSPQPSADLLERAYAAFIPPVVDTDPYDPYACQSCHLRPATVLVTFVDDEGFEVCAGCGALAEIDGVVLTAIEMVVMVP